MDTKTFAASALDFLRAQAKEQGLNADEVVAAIVAAAGSSVALTTRNTALAPQAAPASSGMAVLVGQVDRFWHLTRTGAADPQVAQGGAKRPNALLYGTQDQARMAAHGWGIAPQVGPVPPGMRIIDLTGRGLPELRGEVVEGGRSLPSRQVRQLGRGRKGLLAARK